VSLSLDVLCTWPFLLLPLYSGEMLASGVGKWTHDSYLTLSLCHCVTVSLYSGEMLAPGVGKWTHDDCVAVHRSLQEGLLAERGSSSR